MSSTEACYRRHEQGKRRSYEKHILEVEHGTFTPLVLSSSGGCGLSPMHGCPQGACRSHRRETWTTLQQFPQLHQMQACVWLAQCLVPKTCLSCPSTGNQPLSSCSLPMVARTAAAFPLCTAIEMHCRSSTLFDCRFSSSLEEASTKLPHEFLSCLT